MNEEGLALTLRQYFLKNLDRLQSRPFYKNLFSDLLPTNVILINQLLAAFDQGTVKTLLESNERSSFFIGGLSSRFQNTSGYSYEDCSKVVHILAKAIDASVQKSFAIFLAEEKAKNKAVEDFEEYAEIPLKVPERILWKSQDFLIPCGVGNSDDGFVVHGIKRIGQCRYDHLSILAVVFHYLQRSAHFDEHKDIPAYLKMRIEKDLQYKPDYRTVYRLMIFLLLFIKSNENKGQQLAFKYDGQIDELQLAVDTLNYYLALFGRLARVQIKPFVYVEAPLPLVSFKDTKAKFLITDYHGDCEARELWIEKNIIYQLGESHKKDLEVILHEISPYPTFLEGQFEALCKMINVQDHSVCIMPTGSGKSLIYYFVAILQPSVTIVIAPTDILIEDQISNLNNIHRIHDVEKVQYTGKDCFKNYVLCHKLMFITPNTFQDRALLSEFQGWNFKHNICTLVLDEVHCLSNWSHDFRPEYLMLSKYINQYLDSAFFKGYTATANYTVIKDIEKQLNILSGNVVSPRSLIRTNISYHFISCENEDEMNDKLIEYLTNFLQIGQRTIVFSKSDDISLKLSQLLPENLKYYVSVYKHKDASAYRRFASHKINTLITSDELGVGINLPAVHNVIHYGLPISKAEYVQQIGRAGRNGESSTSIILYLSPSSRNIETSLLNRTTEPILFLETLEKCVEHNDYILTIKRFVGNLRDRQELTQLMNEIFDWLRKRIHQYGQFYQFEYTAKHDILLTKRCFYILYILKLITYWSLSDANHVSVSVEDNSNISDLSMVKEHLIAYLESVGNDLKSIYKANSAKNILEIFQSYFNWYYEYFVYKHREQFLDLVSFLENHKVIQYDKYGAQLTSDVLAAYFTLNMDEVGAIEAEYSLLSYLSISALASAEVAGTTVATIERLNQDKYSNKLDWFILVYDIAKQNAFEISRLERIIKNIESTDASDFCTAYATVYPLLNENSRLASFECILNYKKQLSITFPLLLDKVFEKNLKDIVYYGMFTKEINKVFMGDVCDV